MYINILTFENLGPAVGAEYDVGYRRHVSQVSIITNSHKYSYICMYTHTHTQPSGLSMMWDIVDMLKLLNYEVCSKVLCV